MIKKELIDNINKDPIATLKLLTNEQVVEVLEASDEAFFNTYVTLFSDDTYDIIKGYLKKKDVKNPYLKKVGANIEFNKEILPFYMGSLDKIKDNEKEILKWQDKYKGDYIISEKLDGISCLLYHDNGETKLLTRGNGTEGQNITHILPYLNLNLDKLTQKIAIRGELIISRANWDKISDIGANARNVVAGAVHSKSINNNIVSKIDFVAYDMMFPRQTLSKSFEIIKSLSVPVVKYTKFETKMSLDSLSATLQKWRKESEYEIDGIVIYHDEDHKLIVGKNPKYAFAFKTILTNEQVDVIVTDVEWNVSKHRYLKPIVKFNEVSLAGVKIKQATGFNASFIKKHNIGIGSRIIIIRSGDVIPHILQVITPSSNGKPKMPDVKYEWIDSGVDIMLVGVEKNKEHDIQMFSHFMKTLSIEGVKEGVINKLYDAGFDTLSKIINIELVDFYNIKGFQAKSAVKVFEALQEIKSVCCDKLLTASNVFGRGFGDKKFKLITDEYPFIAYDKLRAESLTMQDITKIKGIAETSAQQFIDNLPKFYEFCHQIGIVCESPIKVSSSQKAKQSSPISNNKLAIFKDKKIVFTGFRNKDYERILEANGCKIVTTISKLTNFLIVKDNEKNAKVQRANDLGITIITKVALEKMIQ